MTKIIPFAMFSTRRQDEICRIVRPDLDEARSRVVVRDMKHPGDKTGNDVRCNLPPEALAIIKTIPEREKEPRIFPYDPQSISTAFTRACKLLGIVDLVFHDLRHDGISRLFEMGNTIPEVAAVSGHRQWKSLQRYTQLDQVGDKYEGWAWKGRSLAWPSSADDEIGRSGLGLADLPALHLGPMARPEALALRNGGLLLAEVRGDQRVILRQAPARPVLVGGQAVFAHQPPAQQLLRQAVLEADDGVGKHALFDRHRRLVVTLATDRGAEPLRPGVRRLHGRGDLGRGNGVATFRACDGGGGGGGAGGGQPMR